MSAYVDEKRVLYEIVSTGQKSNNNAADVPNSVINKDGEPPTVSMEAEKRIRREIANSNERRRMQSINNGFQSLRSLLPHHEGEKLSKAAILQQTAEYIYSLEQEKTRLLSQNCQLKRLVNQHEGGELPPKKRKTTELIVPTITTESSDEGLGSMSPEPVNIMQVSVVNQHEATSELKRQLERERGIRMVLENQIRQLEGQLLQLQQQTHLYSVEESEELGLQLLAADSLPPVARTQTVVTCSPNVSRSPSPEPAPEQRLPSVLEAAIKAEPKVEVERLPSPNTPHEEVAPARIYVSNTSRQNLETIVEAIRHLEGDHMFGDEPQQQQQQKQQQQEVPLALTTRTSEHLLQVEVNPFIEFSTSSVQHQQQSRPSVVVVKQAS